MVDSELRPTLFPSTLFRTVEKGLFDKTAEPFDSVLSNQCSTPPSTSSEAILGIFRGGPAIAKFDWTFTPTRKSPEQNILAPVAGLHQLESRLRPAHE